MANRHKNKMFCITNYQENANANIQISPHTGENVLFQKCQKQVFGAKWHNQCKQVQQKAKPLIDHVYVN